MSEELDYHVTGVDPLEYADRLDALARFVRGWGEESARRLESLAWMLRASTWLVGDDAERNEDNKRDEDGQLDAG